MRTIVKNTLKKIGLHKVKRAVQDKIDATRLSGRSSEDIFTDIYKNNSWNGTESISGQGSDLAETQILLAKLPDFLNRHKINTMIDLPCGDFNWMQHLEYEFDHYTGIDIVGDIIAKNNHHYATDWRSFEKKDCLKDNIGSADLLFCRDLLIHFSHEDVLTFLKNVARTDITYLLTTHFIGEKNRDIVTGQWRPINLTAAPYMLPDPIDYILEETKMFEGRFAKIKAMALWRMADIKKIL